MRTQRARVAYGGASGTRNFASSMSQLRLDPLTGRWVVISADRADRPQPFASRALPAQNDPEAPCPFCPGNEEATPPALETYGPQGDWLVRVVPNLYPAFSGRELMSVTNIGPVFTQAPASGIHEVVVFSPATTRPGPTCPTRRPAS